MSKKEKKAAVVAAEKPETHEVQVPETISEPVHSEFAPSALWTVSPVDTSNISFGIFPSEKEAKLVEERLNGKYEAMGMSLRVKAVPVNAS